MTLDFKKLNTGKSADTIFDPQKIFHALPAKDKKYTYLRDVQGEVLSAWLSRRNEKDLVVKMNTGSGKTVVGLLMLKACLNEDQGPAVYIVPDKYLTEQVLKEAKSLGIEAVDEITNPRFMQGKAIFVTNIRTLINGMSKFGVGREGAKIEIGSIIIDDAHACMAIVEQQFCLNIPNTHEIYTSLLALFKQDLQGQDTVGTQDLEQGDPRALITVPYWAWIDKQDQIIKTINAAKTDDLLKFNWPLIKDILSLCRCIFGGTQLEISAPCLPISSIPSFATAKRRIYMTATLANDTILVSDFDANPQSVKEPISPKTANDIGDRMILIPQELNPNTTDDQIKTLVSGFSKKENVVVIVPSRYRAEYWKDVAQLVLNTNNIDDGVEKLCSGHVGLMVIINRYEGIDLPDGACRLLVIDGLPDVHRLRDKIEQAVLSGSKAYRSKQIQKIEQGMGRGIRSTDDYCAVILMGASLIRQLNMKGAKDFLTPATQAQLELSSQVAAQIEGKGLKAIEEVINILLSRNPEWVQQAKNALIEISYPKETKINETVVLQRKAFDAAQGNRFAEAVECMEGAVALEQENAVAAWMMQQEAEYLHHIDKVRSQSVLTAASKKSLNILKPMVGIEYRKIQTANMEQAKICSDFLKQRFSSANEMIIEVNGLASDLVFAPNSYNSFEAALSEIAYHIGFVGQRPEKQSNTGPDVLWAVGDKKYYVIECKNEATAALISKKYSNDLAGHVNWFGRVYDQTCVCTPIMVHKSRIFDRLASPHAKTRIINEEKLPLLVNAIKGFAIAVADKQDDVKAIRDALAANKLTASAFIDAFTVNYKISEK